MHAGATFGQVLRADIRQQGAPQRGLPARIALQWPLTTARGAQAVLSAGPVRQPVGTVDLILVEQIGQALGQLVALAQILVIGEKAAQGRKRLLGQQARQQAHQAPGQRRLVQRRLLRDRVLAQHVAVRLPEKARRQVNVQRRRDATAVTLGQRQLEPLGDAVALHQQHLIFQRPQWIAPHPLHRQRTQLFEMVTVNDDKTGGQLRTGGHRLTPVENRSASLPAFTEEVSLWPAFTTV